MCARGRISHGSLAEVMDDVAVVHFRWIGSDGSGEQKRLRVVVERLIHFLHRHFNHSVEDEIGYFDQNVELLSRIVRCSSFLVTRKLPVLRKRTNHRLRAVDRTSLRTKSMPSKFQSRTNIFACRMNKARVDALARTLLNASLAAVQPPTATSTLIEDLVRRLRSLI